MFLIFMYVFVERPLLRKLAFKLGSGGEKLSRDLAVIQLMLFIHHFETEIALFSLRPFISRA